MAERCDGRGVIPTKTSIKNLQLMFTGADVFYSVSGAKSANAVALVDGTGTGQNFVVMPGTCPNFENGSCKLANACLAHK